MTTRPKPHRALLDHPIGESPCGRFFVRHLLLPDRENGPRSYFEHTIVWGRDATPVELTARCRELGVSPALSWLASHSEPLNASYLVGCEIVYRSVPRGLLPPGEWVLVDGEWVRPSSPA
jgi:hypothetical protein